MKTTIIVSCLLISCMHMFAQSGGNYNSLEFVENKGQWDNEVKFQADFGSGAFFLRKNGIAVMQRDVRDMANLGHPRDASDDSLHSRPIPAAKPGADDDNTVKTLHSHIYFVDFVGANENVVLTGEKVQPSYYNYFIGNDKSKWQGECKIYQSVLYKNIYPNIDLRYFTNDGMMKYEFIVNPGGDPSKIVMQFRGADKLSTNRNNELVVKTSVGDVNELYPYTYQVQNNSKVKIDCKYAVSGTTVKFKLSKFDNTQTLVIDPTLIFASFTGSRADNWGYTATYGNDGTLYAGGIVFANGFVTTAGAFQTSYSGRGQEMFNMGIMRFSSGGDTRLFGTYIGGNGKEQPHSMFADGDGNLVIAGRTTSTDYPNTIKMVNGNGGPQDWNIVVTKISAKGSALLGSLLIGGSSNDGQNIGDSHSTIQTNQSLINFYGDDARSEVILDKSNNIYLASCTQSNNFPTVNASQTVFAGGKQDGVLLKINAAFTTVVSSSYFGGNGDDAAFVLALNPATQNIYVAGGTTSTNLPVTAGVIQDKNAGGQCDGFVASFSNDGSKLLTATYLGTKDVDVVYGIQFDRENFPYVMGISNGGTWQPINAPWSQRGSQFVGKLKPDLSDWVFRTSFGTTTKDPNMSPVAFLVDRCENMYISGWGKGYGSFTMEGVNGMSVTPDAIKSQAPDNSDFYFIVIKRGAQAQLYGTFFGQNGGGHDHVDGGTSRFDQNGVIYQAMCANCLASATAPRPQFPITPGAVCCSNKWSGANGSGSGAECNLAAVKIVFNYAGVGSGVKAFLNAKARDKACAPAQFDFRDTVLNAQSYIWDFGDGTQQVATPSFDLSHTYPNVGDYKITLVAIDSNSCNIRDTAYTTVHVRSDKVNFDFSYEKLQPCEELKYRFTNLSSVVSGAPFTDKSFVWNFGDGTTVVAGENPPIEHSYAAAGSYNVTLLLQDTGYCNSPDSSSILLRVSPLVKAQFETPAEGCAPYTARFNNTSMGGQTFDWDFGDGSPISHDVSPVHTFPDGPNLYVVKLTAYDENTCNKVSDTSFTITIHTSPKAAFSFLPLVPQENRPTAFSNNSSTDAIQFVWRFGDGDSLVTKNRSDIQFQYNISGDFEPCLDVVNSFGCHDTACANLKAIVIPKLDVPNAFTPLGPAAASTVYVHGFGINTMKWTIYNRWGQKVFETENRKSGWDGTFKGQMQPMDVYGYTLEVEFVNGTKTTKKGDITLIR